MACLGDLTAFGQPGNPGKPSTVVHRPSSHYDCEWSYACDTLPVAPAFSVIMSETSHMPVTTSQCRMTPLLQLLSHIARRNLNDPLQLLVSGRTFQQQPILRQQEMKPPLFADVPQTTNMDKIINQTPEHVDPYMKGECETLFFWPKRAALHPP